MEEVKMRTLTYLLAWLVLSIPCSAKIIYVDADAAGANDGSNWADAYTNLWITLSGAPSGTEIRVAEGVYKSFNPYSMSPVSRADTFQMKNGVTLKGGYAGFGEPDPDARDIDSYVSVLSGDIAGNDIAVASPEQLLNEPTRAENSYHVVTAIGVDANAVLDGFTITGGQANGGTYEEKYGAGMYNYDASPTVTDCKFGANSALERGGGMYICYGSSEPTLNRCTFTFNHALMGGGIMSYGVPTLTRCTFNINVAKLGGGMWSNGGELSRCVFGNNRSELKGGGIFMSHDTSLTSCMLSGNSADSGGAVFAEDCDITVTGCTITGNRASYVGGVHNDEGSTFVSNCILWNNRDADGEDESAQIDTADPPSVNYCCIQGLTGALGGTGNIGANPAFTQPGHWDTTDVWVDGDYHLLSGSPCINAGDPSYIAGPDETDLDGNARVICGRIDMGAYEFQGPRVIYVDVDATGNNDGTNWTDAYNYLQDALMMASVEDEIRVAEGTYKPDQFVLSDRPNLGRMETFQLKNGVAIKGGYAGFGEPDPDERDIPDYETILSGDVGIAGDTSDNSYHVVTAIGVDATAVLDGFSITGGAADGETNENKHGGGMYNYDASPVVKDCKFGANSAVGGGAIYIRGDFSGTLTDCVFENNTAALGGGAIYCTSTGELSIIRCEFRNGTANRGGVIYNGYASLIFSQCILVGNQAEYAGAISTGGDITLTNCLLANNQALVWGGALSNMMNTSRSVNCTFVGNSANYGGAIFSNIECDTTAINSIFWNNAAQTGSQIATSGDHGGSTLTVNYCDIENRLDGLYVPLGCDLNWGEDNINAEPLFADSGNGDYRLSAGPPCVDAGDNDSVPPDVCDLDGNARIDDGDDDGSLVVDMGAYELGLPPIEVPMKLVPQSLNPGSHGNWVKANFVLPEGFSVEDVDTSRPAEFEQFHLTSESIEVFVNKEDLVEVIAAFDRSAFCGIGPFEGEIAVFGYLTSGRSFRGTDTIKILTNKIKHLAVVASNWLSVCSAPDWCDGADLDQDSVVNFVDVALLDGCCFEVIED